MKGYFDLEDGTLPDTTKFHDSHFPHIVTPGRPSMMRSMAHAILEIGAIIVCNGIAISAKGVEKNPCGIIVISTKLASSNIVTNWDAVNST